jgi:hypothetical protein
LLCEGVSFASEIPKGEIKGEIKCKIMHIMKIMNISEMPYNPTILATFHIISTNAQNEVQVPSPAYINNPETYCL